MYSLLALYTNFNLVLIFYYTFNLVTFRTLLLKREREILTDDPPLAHLLPFAQCEAECIYVMMQDMFIIMHRH